MEEEAKVEQVLGEHPYLRKFTGCLSSENKRLDEVKQPVREHPSLRQ